MFDAYHVGRGQGDVLKRLEKHLPLIGHIQIAAVPSRAEPDEGEIDYPAVLAPSRRLATTAGWAANTSRAAIPTPVSAGARLSPVPAPYRRELCKPLFLERRSTSSSSKAERPKPGPGEALIRVDAAGLCAGDLYIYLGKNPYVSYPRIGGHEIAGHVEALGPDTTGPAIGQRASWSSRSSAAAIAIPAASASPIAAPI